MDPSTIFRSYPGEIGSPKLHGTGGAGKGTKRQWSDVGGQWTERKTEEVQGRGYAGETI